MQQQVRPKQSTTKSTVTDSNRADKEKKGKITMKKNDIFSLASGVLSYATNASPSQTHGPVVKTGPTAGQNRSRNKNGQWRKKRSDAGQKRS